MRLPTLCIILGLSSLSACQIYEPTLNPDYTIKVMDSNNTLVAIPPNCPSWITEQANPYDQQPVPQFGCAQARNLALMTDQPADLVGGRVLGNGRSSVMIGSIRRYDANQTRGLLWTGEDSNTPAASTSNSVNSAINGDAPIAAAASSAVKP